MAKTPNILLTTIVTAVGLGGFWWLKTHKNPFVTAAQGSMHLNMKIQGIHAENDGTINMDIHILNTNSAPFEIQSIVGDLLLNGHVIAAVKMFGDYNVKGNSEQTIPVMMRIISMNLMQQVREVFQRRGSSLELAGDINVNNHSLPFKMRHTI